MVVTGTSLDYIHDFLFADYGFGFDLRDTGTYGYMLPSSQILGTCQEIFGGMRVMFKI